MSIFSKFGFSSTQTQTANVPNYRLSPMPSRGGIIYDSTLVPPVDNRGATIGEIFTSIRVRLGGNLVVQGPAGDILYYSGLLDGQTIYGKFCAVLASANMASTGVSSTTPNAVLNVPVTTTCEGITWYGGES